MAINKKRFRKITVDADVFYWKIKDEVTGFELTVTTGDNAYPALLASFTWHEPWLSFSENTGKELTPTQRIITPNVVRKTIDYALENGWQPHVKSRTRFRLREVDKLIDFG